MPKIIEVEGLERIAEGLEENAKSLNYHYIKNGIQVTLIPTMKESSTALSMIKH